jgi:hypothetical protein
MLVMLLSMVTLVRLLHNLKASFPIWVTLFGMVMPVRLVHSLKARSPMAVTAVLFMVAGISTTPPEPM